MGKIAIVFSGQGAQYPGMGKSLYESSPTAKALFDRAERLMPGIQELCFSGSQEDLNKTIYTQPCLFVTDLAAASAICEAGIKADMTAGFSLGELAAITFAKMLSFETAFMLVMRRAELMQACAEKRSGAMVAVLKLSAEETCNIARNFNNVYPVNFNCPGQTVVAVAEEDYESFTASIKHNGGRAVKLKVNGAFHSPFMHEAAEQFRLYAEQQAFAAPVMPVYANKTAKPYGADAARLLAAQIESPVLWEQTIREMICNGCDTFIEAGAGKTLAGLISKIDAQKNIFYVEDHDSLEKMLNSWGKKEC